MTNIDIIYVKVASISSTIIYFAIIFASTFKRKESRTRRVAKITSESLTKSIASIILTTTICQINFLSIVLISTLRRVLTRNLQYCSKRISIKF